MLMPGNFLSNLTKQNRYAAIAQRYVRYLEIFVLGVISALILVNRTADIPFHPDESHWIATSGYFEKFVSGDFLAPEWDKNNYWPLTQPPLPRYVIAIGRLVGGFDNSSLNSPWDFSKDYSTNEALGNLPNVNLLWWSRIPMAFLTAAGLIILFSLVHLAAGRLTAYLMLLLVLFSEYTSSMLLRAMGEAPMFLFVMAATYSAYRALASWPDRRRSFRWLIFMGIMSGLAAAAKLNASVVVLGGLGVSLILLPMKGEWKSRKERDVFRIRASVVMLLITWATFVSINPFLYRWPVAGAVQMLVWRIKEMLEAQRLYPNQTFPTIADRIQSATAVVLEGSGIFVFVGANILYASLLIAGIYVLAKRGREWFAGASARSAASIVILLCGLLVSIPPLLTPLNWPRYYVLPVIFGTVLISVGAIAILNWAKMVLEDWRAKL